MFQISGHLSGLLLALCRNWLFVQCGAPHSSESSTTIVKINPRSFVVCNVGADYKDPNTVILPSHPSFIVQKQVVGGQSGRPRDTCHVITRHCTIT